MTAETSNARGGLRAGIDRLWDSQWVNIVNSPEVLNAIRNRDYEVAVGVAIRMTEKKMAENFAAALSQQPEAQQPAAGDGDFINRIADSLIAKGWDIDPNCDGTGVAQLREAVISAIAQQPADVVVDDTRGRAK